MPHGVTMSGSAANSSIFSRGSSTWGCIKSALPSASTAASVKHIVHEIMRGTSCKSADNGALAGPRGVASRGALTGWLLRPAYDVGNGFAGLGHGGAIVFAQQRGQRRGYLALRHRRHVLALSQRRCVGAEKA